MAAPMVLENMMFIHKIILEKLQPKKKLIIAEHTRFLALQQGPDEDVHRYSQRLWDAARFCQFDKLNAAGATQSAEDELIQMHMINGMHRLADRLKLLEFIQSATDKTSLEQCVQCAQQLELIPSFDSSMEPINAVAHVDKNNVGGKDKCGYCGRSHVHGKCLAFGKVCKKCFRKNHFAVVCRSSDKTTHEVVAQDKEAEEMDTENFKPVFNINTKKVALQEVKLDDVPMCMQLDSGSQATIIPKNFWMKLRQPKLHRTSHQLKQYDGSEIKTLGQFKGMVEMNGWFAVGNIVVAQCEKNHSLMGTDLLNVDFSKMSVNSISDFNKRNLTKCINFKVSESKLGCLKGFQARIVLKENAQPSYFDARPIPIHLKKSVIKKLEEMIDQGILEPVPCGGSKWASPIVVVPKPNGDLRICADYKVGVNQKICCDTYPMPRIEAAFSSLAGMTHFAKIDLANAYNQLEIEETSREITTISIPIGLLRWKRLPFGIKMASAQFQVAIERMVGKEIDNIIIYQDDICIGGKNESHLSMKVRSVLKRLADAGMTVNESKCVLKATEISFLGYVVSANGVKPDKKLVEKILNIKTPSCKKDVDIFMGLVNYFGRYIENFAEKARLLNEVRGKSKNFEWGVLQQRAFDKLKLVLSRYPVVKIFDPLKSTVLTTDASEKSISGILTQDGHPVMYLSKKLTGSEQNFSNIECEAYAIVWSVLRAEHILLGKKFTLCTDHKPLEYIFHPHRGLPKVTTARLLRWAIQLAAFDYDIMYVKGESIPHVDALSRLDFVEGTRRWRPGCVACVV